MRPYLAILLSFLFVFPATAADSLAPPFYNWSFQKLFGGYENDAAQRGLQVYLEVCSACHTMKHVRYQDLALLDYDEKAIKAIAAEFRVTDGPNEEGEMFERPALPSDHFAMPFANDQAARAANNGAYPTDLSLITKAYPRGSDYVAALLQGYTPAPKNFPLLEGRYYNIYFSGNQIAMPPPLDDQVIDYQDGTPATVRQMSRDVVTFLSWAADPYLEERKTLGAKVFFFVFILALLLTAVKHRIWYHITHIHHDD